MKKSFSFKAASIFAGMATALYFAAFLPATAYAAGGILNLVPSETQAVDISSPAFVATPSTHYMDVSESQAVDTSGPGFVATPSTHYMDVSESQAVDTSGSKFAASPSTHYMVAASHKVHTSVDTPVVAHACGCCAKTTD